MSSARRVGLICLVCVTCLGSGPGLFETPAPPPAPLGWEKHVTPGFEPSIESVLVTRVGFAEGELEAIVREWGPEATPVLLRLYRDERWQDFRSMIVRILACEPTEESKQFALAEMLTFLHKHQPSERDLRVFSSFAYRFAGLLDDKAVVTIHGEFPRFTQRPELTPREEEMLWHLAGLVAKADPAKGIPLLQEHARKGTDQTRHACIIALRNARAPGILELEKLLAEETQDTMMRMSLERRIEDKESRMRAHEPMSIILERERREAGR